MAYSHVLVFFLVVIALVWLGRVLRGLALLHEAERTKDYRLAFHCGRNPHDPRIPLLPFSAQLFSTGSRRPATTLDPLRARQCRAAEHGSAGA